MKRPDPREEVTLPEKLSDVVELFESPIVLAAGILAAALVIAKLVDWFVVRFVRRAAARTETNLDNEVLESLHKPLVKTVVLAGLWFACDVLETEESPLLWAHRLIATLAVFVWTAGALRAAAAILKAASRPDSRFHFVEERTLPLFDNLAKVSLVALAGYLLIEVWKLDATAWLTSAGVAGIAIGFAAKDTLANLFSGVFIIADAPYQIGDYIVLDSGYRGRVQHIGLRSTRILTRDDIEITIPNSIIGNGAIVNETSGTPQYRVRVKVGVAYGSDLERVRTALVETAGAVEHTLTEPEPRVRLRNFGASSLDYELLVWIREPELRGRVLDALNSAVYERFRADGIEIAFPQQDLHIRTAPAGFTGDDT